MFCGVYHGKQVHVGDIKTILERAWNRNVKGVLVTGTSQKDAEQCIKLCRDLRVHANIPRLFCTVGVHPSNCLDLVGGEAAADDIDAQEQKTASSVEQKVQQLVELIEGHRDVVIASGECGLDYDRMYAATREQQQEAFRLQMDRFSKMDSPLFLHCRNTGMDFIDMMRSYKGVRGVVHSFTGTVTEMRILTEELQLYIGVNGCSLKTTENLAVVKEIPLDRLLLETDAPWCDIRQTHASHQYIAGTEHDMMRGTGAVKKEKYQPQLMVKGRNEPCTMNSVLAVVASLRNMSMDQLADHVHANTVRLFPQFDIEQDASDLI